MSTTVVIVKTPSSSEKGSYNKNLGYGGGSYNKNSYQNFVGRGSQPGGNSTFGGRLQGQPSTTYKNFIPRHYNGASCSKSRC